MKRILTLVLIVWAMTLASAFWPARPALAASDDVVATVTITADQSTNIANQISADLRVGTDVTQSKQLAVASSTNQQVTYTPVTFSSVTAGNYQLCIASTNQCQAFTKQDGVAANVSLNTTLNPADITAISSTSADSTSACNDAAGQLNWIVCPVVNGMLKAISGIENNVVIPFLKTQPLSRTNPDGSVSPIYSIWSVMRQVANALFILIFLIIIFAQTLSIGIDAYTIKRTLPRLVAAAILVQFSFVIASLGVDISNIMGAGIKTLIDTTLAATHGNAFSFTYATGGLGIAALAIGALAAAGAIISGAAFILILGAFFGILGVFFTLVARQIIITLLIILSPIAFILWILPNTQNAFYFWQKNFVRILLMYPLIVLLFASSRIVAVVATASGAANGGFTAQISAVVALAAAIIPLFLIPATFKFSGSLMMMTSQWSQKLSGYLKTKTEGTAQYQQLKATTARRRKSLAGGQGVSLRPGGDVHMLGGAGRLAGGGVLAFGKAGQTKALKGLKEAEKGASDELKELNLSPDGQRMVLQGRKATTKMIADAKSDLSRLQATPGASQNEITMARQKVDELESQEKLARRYFGNSAAQIAAFNALGENTLLERDDVKVLQARAQSTGVVGEAYGRQTWAGNKFRFMEGDPVLAATTIDGVVSYKDVMKSLSGRSPDKWKSLTKGGLEEIAAIGMLDSASDATLDEITRADSPNRVGDIHVELIRNYRTAKEQLTKPAADQDAWASPANISDILGQKSILGGLISSGSGNTPPERRLRKRIADQLGNITTKADYAATIEHKLPEHVSDGDFEDFMDYRNSWLGRVDTATGEKKDV